MIIHEQLLWLVPFKCGVWNFWILLRSSFLLLDYDEIIMSTAILWGWPGWRYFMFWFYPDLLLVGDGHFTSVVTESANIRLILLSRQYFLYFNLAFNSRKTFISSLESLQTFLFLFWLNFCIVPLNCCDLRKFNWVAAFDWRLDQLLLELLLFLESLLHGFDCSLLIDGVIVRLRQTICQI